MKKDQKRQFNADLMQNDVKRLYRKGLASLGSPNWPIFIRLFVISGIWIAEIGELAGMKKADIEKVKAFLSTSDDKYRPSYGRVVESHPRQSVIVATVNGERGYLRDVTGNRRFWVVKCHQKEALRKFSFTPEERDQIWAEAMQIWRGGEKLYLEGELLCEAEEAQREAMEADERIGMVGEYLETLLPGNWDSMDLYARRSWLNDPTDPTRPKGVARRMQVSNVEIWAECFGRNPADMKSADSYAIAAIMLQLDGWEKSWERKRIPIYGMQRLYFRKENFQPIDTGAYCDRSGAAEVPDFLN